MYDVDIWFLYVYDVCSHVWKYIQHEYIYMNILYIYICNKYQVSILYININDRINVQVNMYFYLELC